MKKLIGVHQFTILVIFFGIGTSILIAPALLASGAKQDGWLSAIIGLFAGLVPIAIYNALSKRYPDLTIVQMNEAAFGKWIGRLVSLVYVLFFLLLAILLLGDVGFFLTTEIIPETPLDFISVCLMLVVIMAVRLGPEVIARGAEIFFPWAILLFAILFLLLTPEIDLTKVQPVLEYGAGPIAEAALPFTGLQEYVVLMMILPYVRNSPRTPLAFYAGALIAGLVLVIIAALCTLVLGPGITAASIYPSYILAKKISVGDFLERVEVIIGGLWFITITFKLILTFFACSLGSTQLLRLRSHADLAIPLGMLAVVSVMPVYSNIVYVMQMIQQIWTPYALTFMVALPAAALASIKLRDRFGQGKNA